MAENRTLKGIYGEAGVHLVVTGNTAVGEFCAITSLHDDTTITVVSAEMTKNRQGDTISGTSALSSLVLPKGITVYGQFTSVAIAGTAGKAIVYNAA
tara:strand:- start:260 stop:550 length:291 start_codon:yes stop_codon:yes gene_type:complete